MTVPSTWQAHWDGIEEIHEWLNENPAIYGDPVVWRIMKIAEEYGEVTAALIASSGQNPRKKVVTELRDQDDLWDDVIKELCDVIVTAMVALRAATPYASDTFYNHMTSVLVRMSEKRKS